MKTSQLKMVVRVAMVAACFVVYAACCQEKAAAGQVGQTEASLAGGTPIHADLNGGIDSKKAKAGDAISLRTTEAVKSSDDRMILPRGTKLVGHITQAEARSKGAEESALGMVFDKAVLKDGREVPLSVIMQALGAPAAFSGGPDSEPVAGPYFGNHAYCADFTDGQPWWAASCPTAGWRSGLRVANHLGREPIAGSE